MKRLPIACTLLCAVLFFISCERDISYVPFQKIDENDLSSTSINPELIARELTDMNGWQVEENTDQPKDNQALQKSAGYYIMNFQRNHIIEDIYHYKFQVRTGSGPYDIIGIHRVVKERWFGLPARTELSLFFQHGDAKDFEGMMLPATHSPSTPPDFGMAVYLAKKNVDVWGIDQAWTLVPEGTSDLSFMQDWGLQRQVDDLSIAIAIARYTRLFSGGGFGKMILSGYSSGVFTGFALLNEETQKRPALRQVSGFIPMDFGVKMNDACFKPYFSDFYYYMLNVMNNGVYHEDVPFKPLGFLARNDPDSPSPMLEGLTNLQAALFFGAGQIFGPDGVFHYLAGNLEDGLPTSLQLVTNEQWFDFLESAPPYEPLKFEADYAALMTDVVDVPFDDHLSKIEVPIFNLAAAGGGGDLSIYGTTFLGSDDITHLIVSIGASSPVEEFGHIDLFIASNAPMLVWDPIYQWLKSHHKRSARDEFDNMAYDVE